VDRDAADADGDDVSAIGGAVMVDLDRDTRRSCHPDGLVTPRALRRFGGIDGVPIAGLRK
jgi:hypothetical protein